MTLPPVSNRRLVDFGPGIGRKGVWLYPLPEVASGHQVFGVPNISARFGTDPDLWNWAMWAMARLVPKSKEQSYFPGQHRQRQLYFFYCGVMHLT